MACTSNALSRKTVIALSNGKRLGHICNYEIDPVCGTVTAVFVPGEGGFLGFGRPSEIRIPWDKIKKIGEDAILADVPLKMGECVTRQKRRLF